MKKDKKQKRAKDRFKTAAQKEPAYISAYPKEMRHVMRLGLKIQAQQRG